MSSLFSMFLSMALVWLISTPMFAAAKVQLNLLVWEGYTNSAMIGSFRTAMKQKYQVDVAMNIAAAETNFDFFHAVRSKKADIISPSHNLIKDDRFNYLTNQLLLPLDKQLVPNQRDLEPELLANSFYSDASGRLFAAPLCQGPYGLAYNTARVPQAPRSWQVLWASEAQGQYTLAGDFPEVNIYITGLQIGVPRKDLFQIGVIDFPKFSETLQQLAAGSGAMYGVIEEAQDLKGKKYAATWGFAFKALEESGEVWKFANPKEGTPWWIDTLAVGAHVTGLQRKVALEFINFALSRRYQESVVVADLRAGTTVTTVTPEHQARFAVIPKEQRILWQVLSKRERNGFARVWKNTRKQAGKLR